MKFFGSLLGAEEKKPKPPPFTAEEKSLGIGSDMVVFVKELAQVIILTLSFFFFFFLLFFPPRCL
jgi:hypothetical protein